MYFLDEIHALNLITSENTNYLVDLPLNDTKVDHWINMVA